MHDPIARFDQWLRDAKACAAIAEPTAMALATATPDGKPSLRMVLLKEHGAGEFVFYTNIHSRKGQELTANENTALCFYWMPLGRQIRIEGPAFRVDDARADAYFATRSRASQIGAWASQQSHPMTSHDALRARIAEFEKKFAGRDVPRPPHWSGWWLSAERLEFWSQGDSRLHERDLYERMVNGEWAHSVLYP